MNLSYLKHAGESACAKLGGNSVNALAIMAQFIQEKGLQWWENPQPPYNVGNVRHVDGQFKVFGSLDEGVQGYVDFLETDPAGYYTKVREAIKHGTPHDVLVALAESPYCYPNYPLSELVGDLQEVERLMGEQPITEPVHPEVHPGKWVTVTAKPPFNTFWGISMALYHNPGECGRIMRLNPGVDPRRLQVGEKIRVE